MKRLLVSFFGLVLPLFLITAPVLAVDVVDPVCQDPSAADSTVCQENQSNAAEGVGNPIVGPNGILTTAIVILSLVVGVISVIIIVIAGIKISLSQGNPQSISNSRNHIIYAIVGLIVAVLAQAAVIFVIRRL